MSQNVKIPMMFWSSTARYFCTVIKISFRKVDTTSQNIFFQKLIKLLQNLLLGKRLFIFW